MLPGAALGSLAARFRRTHVRSRCGASLDRHTVDAHTFAHGARARFTLDTHLRPLRLVSAGRGSTSGSGRCPSAFRGPPPLDAARRRTWEPRGSFLLAGAALQALDGTRARFGAPPLDAARRSTWQPRGSFLLAGAALQALDGTRARFGAPAMRACAAGLAARFCWQGQRFRLWMVPERVSGPPPSEPRGSFLLAGRFGAPSVDAARRSTWEPRGSFLPGAWRLTWEPRGSFLLAGAALQALDGTRARFGPPPLDAARRSTWEPRGSFLLAGAALQALDGTRARFGAPLLMLPGAALGQADSSRAPHHQLAEAEAQRKPGRRPTKSTARPRRDPKQKLAKSGSAARSRKGACRKQSTQKTQAGRRHWSLELLFARLECTPGSPRVASCRVSRAAARLKAKSVSSKAAGNSVAKSKPAKTNSSLKRKSIAVLSHAGYPKRRPAAVHVPKNHLEDLFA